MAIKSNLKTNILILITAILLALLLKALIGIGVKTSHNQEMLIQAFYDYIKPTQEILNKINNIIEE